MSYGMGQSIGQTIGGLIPTKGQRAMKADTKWWNDFLQMQSSNEVKFSFDGTRVRASGNPDLPTLTEKWEDYRKAIENTGATPDYGSFKEKYEAVYNNWQQEMFNKLTTLDSLGIPKYAIQEMMMSQPQLSQAFDKIALTNPEAAAIVADYQDTQRPTFEDQLLDQEQYKGAALATGAAALHGWGTGQGAFRGATLRAAGNPLKGKGAFGGALGQRGGERYLTDRAGKILSASVDKKLKNPTTTKGGSWKRNAIDFRKSKIFQSDRGKEILQGMIDEGEEGLFKEKNLKTTVKGGAKASKAEKAFKEAKSISDKYHNKGSEWTKKGNKLKIKKGYQMNVKPKGNFTIDMGRGKLATFTKDGKASNSIAKALVKNKKYEDFITKKGNKRIFSKTKYNKLINQSIKNTGTKLKAWNTAKGNVKTIAQKAGMGALKTGKLQQKAATQVVKTFIKKHGMSGLMKKIGWKAAARLGIGAALSGTGVGTVVGAGLTAWQIKEIADMLTSAYKGSSGVGLLREKEQTRRGIRI